MIYISENTRIKFRHMFDNIIVSNEETGEAHIVRGITTCFIETKGKDGTWVVWKTGHAICSLSEKNFERSIGRKIALTRALQTVEPKSLRKDIWETYFRNVKR